MARGSNGLVYLPGSGRGITPALDGEQQRSKLQPGENFGGRGDDHHHRVLLPLLRQRQPLRLLAGVGGTEDRMSRDQAGAVPGQRQDASGTPGPQIR